MRLDARVLETSIRARAAQADAQRDRYTLALALRIVARLESSAAREAVFEEIKRKNPIFRIVDSIYRGSGPLKPLALLAFMAKCVASAGAPDSGDAQALSVAQFDNEQNAIDRVAKLVSEARIQHLKLTNRRCPGWRDMRAVLRLIGAAPRVWPFLSRLARNYSFMPAGRIAGALAFYMHFRNFLADNPQLVTAVVASNYSPDGLGLAAAAHRCGRRVVYINHAPVPSNAPLVPPVLADCAVFYGDMVKRTYDGRSRCTGDVALIGQPYTSRPMQFGDKIRMIGIFLTGLTDSDAVARLVCSILEHSPDVRILIRNHPVALLKSDFTELVAQHPSVTVTIGNPLDEEIAACDLIICGNSGVAMNAVSGGRPVAYMDSLDGSMFDYNGFVGNGLVRHVKAWNDRVYDELKLFYGRPDWRAVMRSYDAAYDCDADGLNARASVILRRHFGAALSGGTRPIAVGSEGPAQRASQSEGRRAHRRVSGGRA